MSTPTRTALAYGAWFVLTGIVVTAIWVNLPNYAEQDPVSQIALAIHERCLATQTTQGSNVVQAVTNIVIGYTNDPSGKLYVEYSNGVPFSLPYLVRTTNSAVSTVTTEMGYAYSVAPLNYATPITWAPGKYITGYTTNLDGTNIVSIYTNDAMLFLTNAWTNTIGWYADGAMVDAMQDKIRELIPYYVNPTNILPNGFLTNFTSKSIPPPDWNCYWTVTNFFRTLGIGDLTNQFTLFPGLTNIVTNYWIIYTNFPASVVSYSSAVGQVCNVQVAGGVYSNMEFTGVSHIVVATVTSAPVWFNGNYVTTNTLNEMARAVYNLRSTTKLLDVTGKWKGAWAIEGSPYTETWENVRDRAIANYATSVWSSYSSVLGNQLFFMQQAGVHRVVGEVFSAIIVGSENTLTLTNLPSISKNVRIQCKLFTPYSYGFYDVAGYVPSGQDYPDYVPVEYNIWESSGLSGDGGEVIEGTNLFLSVSGHTTGTISFVLGIGDTCPTFANPPEFPDTWGSYDGGAVNWNLWGDSTAFPLAVITWNFQYCTNAIP